MSGQSTTLARMEKVRRLSPLILIALCGLISLALAIFPPARAKPIPALLGATMIAAVPGQPAQAILARRDGVVAFVESSINGAKTIDDIGSALDAKRGGLLAIATSPTLHTDGLIYLLGIERHRQTLTLWERHLPPGSVRVEPHGRAVLRIPVPREFNRDSIALQFDQSDGTLWITGDGVRRHINPSKSRDGAPYTQVSNGTAPPPPSALAVSLSPTGSLESIETTGGVLPHLRAHRLNGDRGSVFALEAHVFGTPTAHYRFTTDGGKLTALGDTATLDPGSSPRTVTVSIPHRRDSPTQASVVIFPHGPPRYDNTAPKVTVSTESSSRLSYKVHVSSSEPGRARVWLSGPKGELASTVVDLRAGSGTVTLKLAKLLPPGVPITAAARVVDMSHNAGRARAQVSG